MKPKVLVILGPTAVGKSSLAVKIAKKYNGEVISADSRQVYKGLDIGTGKITKKEMQGVQHWLLDVASPKKTFSVAEFKKQAEEKIEAILKRHKLPIICGGTGFYIDSIVNNIVLPEVRADKKLRNDLSKKETKELLLILKKLDKGRFSNIDQNNRVRIIRAIEIAKTLGKVPKITSLPAKYDFLQIGINIDGEELRDKINTRLTKRMKIGMIKEAQVLHKKGLSFKRMRELGLEYRFLADFLENRINKAEMLKKLNTEIWQYSRRQMTWFKRPARPHESGASGDKNIKWFDVKEIGKMEKEIHNFID